MIENGNIMVYIIFKAAARVLDILAIEWAYSVGIGRYLDALNHTSVGISRFFDASNHISVNISQFLDAQIKNQSVSIGFCKHNFLPIQYQYNFWLKYFGRFLLFQIIYQY